MTATAPLHRRRAATNAQAPLRRVAAYCRKSVDKGDQQYTSVENQRESLAAFVAQHEHEGWVLLSARYDDIGKSGGTLRRPSLQRLLADVASGAVDLVAVHMLDRLSRSTSDFVKLMELFQAHGVQVVCPNERISATNAAERLELGVRMNVAQYHREVTAERVTAKTHAARRKGMWTGGRPVLGYDCVDRRLVVNRREAKRVREIYQLYLRCGSVLALETELRHRGWVNKTWTTKKGEPTGGQPFGKNTLLRLLRDPLYLGRMRLGAETFEGQHAAIVDEGIYNQVQALLAGKGAEKRAMAMKYDCLLQGLVRCGVCGKAMGHHSTQRHGRRYASYVCQSIQKRGAAACKGSRVPVHRLDGFVTEKLCALGRDEAIVAETVAATRKGLRTRGPAIRTELKDLLGERRVLDRSRRRLVDAVATGANGTTGVLERLRETEARLAEIDAQTDALRREAEALKAQALDENELRQALASFTPVWDQLFPTEQKRLVQLLVAEVRYHGPAGTIEIDYRADGIKALAAQAKEAAA